MTRLNHPNRSLIVPAMRRPAIALIFFLLSALPLMAQTPSSEFGLLIGGNERYLSRNDRGADDSFSFQNRVKEAYYGVQMDPDTWFLVKVGEITGTTVFRYDTHTQNAAQKEVFANAQDVNGKTDYADGIVSYRFSEPFGSTALFAGAGYYRARGTLGATDIKGGTIPAAEQGSHSQTTYGFQLGVHADFPLSRRYGIITEGAYHWVGTDIKARYVSVTGGLRIAF